jgi:hypothetical protein
MLLSSFLQCLVSVAETVQVGICAICIFGIAQVWFVYQAVFCGTFIVTVFGTLPVDHVTQTMVEYGCSLDLSTSAIKFSVESHYLSLE